jgi:hypothetical protein
MGGRGASSDAKKLTDWLKKETEGGGGKAIPMDINKFQGMTLEQIEGRLRNLKHEELFALDKDGKIVAAYLGDSTSVSFPETLRDVKGLTVTHGHPKSAAEFGGTFSFADMANMLKSKWSEHRATASGQGEMNYILKRNTKANSKGFYNRINKDYERLNKKITSTYTESYKKATKGGATRKVAMHVARQSAVGVLNQYYKTTAKHYGFSYVTRKEAYTYGR